MRHRKAGRKFDTNSSHRKAMFRNMVTSLMVHGQIKTTTQKAKELRRVADKVISLGKRAPSVADIEALSGTEQSDARSTRVAAIRRARLWIHDKDALQRVFGDYAERFAARPGGYTRIIKAGFRAGDNAEMAYIALVGDFDASAVKEKRAVAAADEEATVAYDGSEKLVDDLTKVEGIGPKINELLQAGGFNTFADLAASKVEDIQKILDDAGSRFRQHKPDTWAEQAGLAAAGKWDELKTLQDELDGGKRD